MTIQDVIYALDDEVILAIADTGLYPDRPGCGSITLSNGIDISITNDGYGKLTGGYEVQVSSGDRSLDAILMQTVLNGVILDTVVGYLDLAEVTRLVLKCYRVPSEQLLNPISPPLPMAYELE